MSTSRSIDTAYYDLILGCEGGANARHELLHNTVLVGGLAKMRGFGNRLEHEILRGGGRKGGSFRLLQDPQGEYAAWRGTAILASSSYRYSRMIVAREEFRESGVETLRNRWVWG